MARDIHQWVSSYGESHQNPTNKKIHWICVPLIMFTLLGLLSLVNFTISLNEDIYDISLSYILIFIALVFYLRLSIIISIGMFLISVVQLLSIFYLESIYSESQLFLIYIVIFTFFANC